MRPTGTESGLFAAFAAVIEIVLLYVPAVSPVVLTETANVAGVLPLEGVTLSQLAPGVAVAFNTIPVLVTLKFWDAGCAPPIS